MTKQPPQIYAQTQAFKSTSNHQGLVYKVIDNYLAIKSSTQSYNSSFLNSTSLDSQQASQVFINHLVNMTDSVASSSSNQLQQAVLQALNAMDSSSGTTSSSQQDLLNSAKNLLQSNSLQSEANDIRSLLTSISQSLHYQSGSFLGQIINTNV
jgi:hypothetical protein